MTLYCLTTANNLIATLIKFHSLYRQNFSSNFYFWFSRESNISTLCTANDKICEQYRAITQRVDFEVYLDGLLSHPITRPANCFFDCSLPEVWHMESFLWKRKLFWGKSRADVVASLATDSGLKNCWLVIDSTSITVKLLRTVKFRRHKSAITRSNQHVYNLFWRSTYNSCHSQVAGERERKKDEITGLTYFLLSSHCNCTSASADCNYRLWRLNGHSAFFCFNAFLCHSSQSKISFTLTLIFTSTSFISLTYFSIKTGSLKFQLSAEKCQLPRLIRSFNERKKIDD